MIKAISTDLSIEKIARSGQCFRMDPFEDHWLLIARGKALDIYAEPEGAFFDCSSEEYRQIWKEYFDMDADYQAFRAAVDPEDGFLTRAAEAGRGIRILRQEPWEALISFIISQRKNIPAIKKSVSVLCSSFGEQIDERKGQPFYAFPTAESLAAASSEQLAACSLGYRAPYISSTARAVAEGRFDLKQAAELDDETLSEKLRELPGVGPKVANCVSLFGYHRIDAFPVDVWIARMIDEQYGGCFPFDRYKGFGGVIQQYIFYYAISNKESINGR